MTNERFMDAVVFLLSVIAIGVVMALDYLRRMTRMLETMLWHFEPKTEGAMGIRSLLIEIDAHLRGMGGRR